MKNLLRDGLLAAPMLLFILNMNPALALEAKADSIGQVTSVSQLADVKSTDWAFEAVQSLAERYGCIAGYPDGTFRGNRTLSRYEFAAGLNACLDRVNELIATSTAGLASQEDLEILQRLQEEFSQELAVLRNRVDRLEAQAKKTEAQQFSTTTKLSGEAIFALAGVTGEARAGGGPLQDNTILGSRVRLSFNSSFTGKDQLRVRLNAGNMTPFNGAVTGTDMTRLSFDGQNSNNVVVDELFYRFPLGKKTNVSLIAQGYGSENIAPSLNPLQSDGAGAISRFGRFSPLYRMADGPGVGISHKFSDAVELSAAYRARNASNPATDRGLFGENTSALAQLTFYPSKNASLGLTYVRTYNAGGTSITGDTGSTFAKNPFGNVDTATNSYGAVASVRVSPKFTLSGWAGVTQAEAKSGSVAGSEATVWNWAATLAFPDLGKKGNLGGIIIGMPPKVTSNDIMARKDSGTSLHLEALYRYQVNDRIAITPGLIMILNPEHNDNNDTIYAGVVRTTFRF